MSNFNPIIVLFLTNNIKCSIELLDTFQSYYSLIFNQTFAPRIVPILEFQSYYSLIFNDFKLLNSLTPYYNFNPIIVLFLTIITSLLSVWCANFNPIIVLFLTGHIFSQKGQKQFIIYLFMHLNLLIIKNVFYLYVSTKKTK